MRTLATLATLLLGTGIVFWAPTGVKPQWTFDIVAFQTASARVVSECIQKAHGSVTKTECEYMMTRGYHAMLEKVGKPVEQLEAEYGDVERGL